MYWGSLDTAFSRIYGCPSRPWLKQKRFGLGMVFVVILFLIATVAVPTAQSILRNGVKHLPFDLEHVGIVVYAGSLAVGLALLFLCLVLIYYRVPNFRVPWRAVWPGALGATVAIGMIDYGFPIYIQRFDAIASFGTVIVMIIVILIWFYLLALIILSGRDRQRAADAAGAAGGVRLAHVHVGEQVHGGRLVTRTLRAHGVSKLFTLSGGHIFPIYDGCLEEGIELVDVRHEQTAAFAAEGWAKVTRSPGVCALTAGPGVTNGMSAIASASQNDSPMLVLGGRAPASRWGQGSLQEIDHVPFVSPLTKFAATAPSTAAIPGLVVTRCRPRSRRRSGPAFVDFPMDIMFASAADDGAASIRCRRSGSAMGRRLRAVERRRRCCARRSGR